MSHVTVWRIECFHAKFRDECLNQRWFVSLNDARQIVEIRRVDYNKEQLHGSLGYLTPGEFAASATARPAFPPTPSARRQHW
jgi:putative transposase